MKNIKIIISFAILIVLLVVKIYTTDDKRKVGHFVNEYNGIIPGHTTLEAMYSKLGEPLKVMPAGGGRNYFYRKVIINFPGKKNTKVNTVQITNDFEYETPTGFKLNDSIYKVASSLGVNANNRSMFDKRYGISYWHDGASVTKIVLGRSAYID